MYNFCMKKLLGILVLGLFWSGNVYACDDVDGATETYTSDCRQIVVTGDGSNITIDGATIKGHSSDNEDGIITTAGTNTTITINSDAAIGHDTENGLDRYGIRHAAGSGTITTITNNGRIETRQSTTNGAGYPIFNGSTIGDIVNSGQIYSNSKLAITNADAGTISKIENTANGNIWSVQKYAIQNLNTIGTITNAGMIRSSKEQAIRNAVNDSGDTITLIENTTSDATIQAKSETIYNSGGGTITTITNAGTIKSWGTDGATITNYNSTIDTIENTGTISTTNTDDSASGKAIISRNGGVINTINNSETGIISAINGNGVIYLNATGAIGTITNSGNITGDDSNAAIKNEGAITTINNSGNITDSTDDGIKNILGATITTINNTGTITGGDLDIDNANDAGASGTITTLINSQGGSDALTYGYKLPTNYKVVLNSDTDYGKIVFSNESSTTTFDVDSSSTFSGSTAKTYTDVISGITESDIESCTSDTDCANNNDSGVLEGHYRYFWKLDDTNGDDDWDLVVTPDREDFQVERNNQKYRAENTLTKLRSLFNTANYIDGKLPDECNTTGLDENSSELKEICNQGFAKVFHSYQKREGIYEGKSSGIVGMLKPIEWKGYPIVSNIFIGYSNQKGDFDNGEYLGGDNYVLGFKNKYQNNGLSFSITPMLGLNELGVKDFDSIKVEKKVTNLLSEFAAVNGKIDKKIGTGEDRYLNISIDGTFGLQKFPDYLAKFTDGDLSVDESIEQLLSGGFGVSYTETLPGKFVIRPYAGVTLSQNLNDVINISGGKTNSNVTNDHQETWSGYHAGVSLVKKIKGVDFDLNLMYGNEDGLINEIAGFSLKKSFGGAKVKTAALEEKPKLSKIDESSTTQDFDKDLKELEELRKANEALKVQNEALKVQNEKLKLLAQKTLEENQASKKLIVELLKENEKIKLEKQMMTNQILESENKDLLEQLEGSNEGNKPPVKFLIIFAIIFMLATIGLTSIVASIYNRIMYRPARA